MRFYLNDDVIHKQYSEWGLGKVTLEFPDGSVLIHWPERGKSHAKAMNTFRYYMEEFDELLPVEIFADDTYF